MGKGCPNEEWRLNEAQSPLNKAMLGIPNGSEWNRTSSLMEEEAADVVCLGPPSGKLSRDEALALALAVQQHFDAQPEPETEWVWVPQTSSRAGQFGMAVSTSRWRCPEGRYPHHHRTSR